MQAEPLAAPKVYRWEMDAELSKRRSEAVRENAYREERLGPLNAVFDGYGLSLSIGGERSPERTVTVPNPDYDIVARALEQGERTSFNSQFGHVTPCGDGSVRLSNYDWNLDTSGEVRIPANQVRQAAELMRSLPFPPFFGVGVGRGEEYRHLNFELVHKAEPDRKGRPWPHDTVLIELFQWYRRDERHVGKRFVATLSLAELIYRAEGQPLHVATPADDFEVEGETMDRLVPWLRRAVRFPPDTG